MIEDALQIFRAGNTPQPVYFYFSRNSAEPARSDPEAILASLARQLSCLEPGESLLQPSIDLYRKRELEGFASGLLRLEETCALLMQLVEKYPQVTIVLDALDECDSKKWRDMLKALDRILKESSNLVKIFVSSRNDQDIVLRLRDYPNLEIDSNRNSGDIDVFVKTRVQELIEDGDFLQHTGFRTEMKEFVVKKVIEGAGGMWANLSDFEYTLTFAIQVSMGEHAVTISMLLQLGCRYSGKRWSTTARFG